MILRLSIIFISLISTISLVGCSNSREYPGSPLDPRPERITANAGSTVCIGTWQVVIDNNSGIIDALMLRNSSNALNIIGFLEPPPLSSLKIDFDSLVIKPGEKSVGVDVILTHPIFTGEKRFNGFDVRGIVFGPDMLNADGYTRWFNPDEFDGMPLGYEDGLLGTPDADAGFPEHFNGFKYFADGIGNEQSVTDYFSSPMNVSLRGVFTEGSSVSRKYTLSWLDKEPPINFVVFNYAVYANYKFPTGDPPFGLDSFSISANSAEPIFAKVTENSNTLFYDPDSGSSGGSIDFDIEIFDWQGVASSYAVSVESVTQGLLDETVADFEYSSGPHTAIFNIQADIQPESTCGIELLITCIDESTYGGNYMFNLMPGGHPLYSEPIAVKFPYTVFVADKPPGLNLVDWGELAEPLPDTDAMDFCVIGNDSIHAGVYYFADSNPVPPDTQGGGIYRYPLDYSNSGYLFYNLHSPFPGYDDYDLWGNASDLASIDMVSFGAGLFLSGSTVESGLPPYLHRDWAYWFNNYITLKNGISSPVNDGILKWVDVSANYLSGSGGWLCALAITEDLLEDTYPPVETEVGLATIRSPWGYYDARFNHAMFEKDDIGNIDGKVDDDFTTRLALDGDPEGVSFTTSNAVVYILENNSNPGIEVFELNLMNEIDSTQTHHITTIHGFNDPDTSPLDIECFPAFNLGFSEDSNWVAVLEDNGDATWQVSLWEQDGSFICRSEFSEGQPMHLDIDHVSGEIHVWVKVNSIPQWAKLSYN